MVEGHAHEKAAAEFLISLWASVAEMNSGAAEVTA